MKNKTFKFAAYQAQPNTFDEVRLPDWPTFFGRSGPLTLELGCGRAELLLELARRHPDRDFVGVDIKSDRMWRPAEAAVNERLKNVAFLRTHLLKLADYFDPASVEELWITFPDPYPRDRQEKHRMVTPAFLDIYKELLRPGAPVRFKTDNRPLFDYALEVFKARPDIKLGEPCFDLHVSDLDDEAKIMTTYEKRFVAEGLKINYVSFVFA